MSASRSATGKRWLIGALLYLSAVAVGVGSALLALKKAPWLNPSARVGAWRVNLHAGSVDADMYTRASVAVNGLLALGREETMYFIAAQDDSGHALRSNCNYRVKGSAPAARWWSITAYADDMFLFDAPNGHYSLNGDIAKRSAEGSFDFTTGPTEQPGSYWLPTPGKRGMVLTLRLYNPDAALQAAPQSLVPPNIQPVGDCV
jgi:hypothetical protein